MDKKAPTTNAKPKNPPVVTEISEKESTAARKYIILMVAIMVLMVVAGGVLIYYLATTYFREANKIKAQDEEITLLTQKKENLMELKPNYEAITAKNGNAPSDSQLILQALPITADFKALIASLEKMGQQSGVKITSVIQGNDPAGGEQSSNQADTGSAKPLSFTVALEGPYAALVEFLKKTEQNSRVINFSSMTLNSSNDQPLQANLTMNTYWQDPANIEPKQEPLK